MEAKIKEIFSSIQGEGTIAGYKQLFIRFCGCNLNCKYCDTNFSATDTISFSPQALTNFIIKNYDLNTFHSISLTGGEPLLNSDFLKEFLTDLKKKSYIKIYLETNATLSAELLKIKNLIDIIAADIKLESSAGKNTFELHDNFLSNCNGIDTFAKIVFDENITQEEIKKCCDLGLKHNIELILQPKMNDKNLCITTEFCSEILDKFLKKYQNVRLIPQIHKFLNLR